MAHPGPGLAVDAVVLSLGAAVLYALTSVLQQSAAATVPQDRSLRPGLLLALVRRPRWVLGTLADAAAITLQFLALRRGSLLLVQVLLVSGLLFALPMGAALTGGRLRPAAWAAAAAVVGGLGLFVSVANPSAGRGDASGVGWTVVLTFGCGTVAVLVAGAPRRSGPSRATVLGMACGALFGVEAALAKAAGHQLDGGLVHALSSWEPYVLLGLAAFGFLLAQSAFQAGPLAASLPFITIVDPVVSALIGALAFRERIAADHLARLVVTGAVAAMAAGAFVLARSPLVTGETATALG